MTFIGIGAMGAGAIMLTRENSTIYSDSSSELQVNWKATGAVWISAGAVLTIIGLTRRK